MSTCMPATFVPRRNLFSFSAEKIEELHALQERFSRRLQSSLEFLRDLIFSGTIIAMSRVIGGKSFEFAKFFRRAAQPAKSGRYQVRRRRPRREHPIARDARCQLSGESDLLDRRQRISALPGPDRDVRAGETTSFGMPTASIAPFRSKKSSCRFVCVRQSGLARRHFPRAETEAAFFFSRPAAEKRGRARRSRHAPRRRAHFARAPRANPRNQTRTKRDMIFAQRIA